MSTTEKKKAGGKKPPAEGANNGTHIEDIAHEEVKTEPGVQVTAATAELITEEEQIKRELVKFNYTDQKIQELKDEFGALTIEGVKDKAGYEKVKKAWNVVRTVRTGFEKKGLELRNQYKKILTAISGEEDRLISLVTPLEDELLAKWKAIDNEKERVKKEQEEAEQKQLMTRLEQLVGLGMKLDGSFYRIGDTISIDIATLRTLPADQYEKLVLAVQAKFKELEDARIKKEQQEEADRKKLQDEQDKLKKEQEQLRAERREIRVGKLELIGMTLEKGVIESMTWKDLKLALAPLLDMSGEEFAKVVETTTAEIKARKDKEAKAEKLAEDTRLRTLALEALDFDRIRTAFVYDDGYHDRISLDADETFHMEEDAWRVKFKSLGEQIMTMKNAKVKHDQELKAEQEAKEVKEKKIAALMQEAGIGYNYNMKIFQFANPQGHAIATWEELLPLDDAELESKINELTSRIKELKTKEEEALKKQEADKKKEEKAALSDAERFKRDLAQVELAVANIAPQEYKTPTFKKRADELLGRATNLLNEFKP
jgi:hypothetical protein